MYSLLVSQAASELDVGSFAFDRSRFLEYSDNAITVQLKSLSREAIASLCSWPCVFMQEGKGDEPARLVKLNTIRVKPRELMVSVRVLEDAPALTNDVLWKLRGALDIGDFEFSRNHWAVKETDLLGVLASAGHQVSRTVRAHFQALPLPAPNRQELLRARDAIGDWGHTRIDELLLEAGIEGINAGRDLGSRRDRANAIVKYAFDNPSATTVENSLFSSFLVRSALTIQSETSIEPSGEQEATVRETDYTPSELPANAVPTRGSRPRRESRSPNRVFLVHGRNEKARQAVTSYLQSIGLQTIVLHEQPNMGRHLLTKFIEEAELVTFAVVLMTDDDVGSVKGEALAPRARQNVILELGYFLSHLGQPNVCALISPGLDTPSDFDGIVYISMTPDGHWQEQLHRELRAAGMPVKS